MEEQVCTQGDLGPKVWIYSLRASIIYIFPGRAQKVVHGTCADNLKQCKIPCNMSSDSRYAQKTGWLHVLWLWVGGNWVVRACWAKNYFQRAQVCIKQIGVKRGRRGPKTVSRGTKCARPFETNGQLAKSVIWWCPAGKDPNHRMRTTEERCLDTMKHKEVIGVSGANYSSWALVIKCKLANHLFRKSYSSGSKSRSASWRSTDCVTFRSRETVCIMSGIFDIFSHEIKYTTCLPQ